MLHTTILDLTRKCPFRSSEDSFVQVRDRLELIQERRSILEYLQESFVCLKDLFVTSRLSA
jgi:hypothetical protein